MPNERRLWQSIQLSYSAQPHINIKIIQNIKRLYSKISSSILLAWQLAPAGGRQIEAGPTRPAFSPVLHLGGGRPRLTYPRRFRDLRFGVLALLTLVHCFFVSLYSYFIHTRLSKNLIDYVLWSLHGSCTNGNPWHSTSMRRSSSQAVKMQYFWIGHFIHICSSNYV